MAAERAMARRLSLVGLVAVVPPPYWSRSEVGDEWTARRHLDHLATADELLRRTLASAANGEPLGIGYDALRAALMDGVEDLSLDEVVVVMADDRERTQQHLEAIPAALLDVVVPLPGVTGPLGNPTGWPVRQFLSAWAEHDTVHELAIRRAITTPPDAAAFAVAARRPR